VQRLPADFVHVVAVDRRFSAAAALIAGLLTMLFGHWTDTSPWSFPWFLLVVLVLLYLPGTMLLPGDSAGITSVERALSVSSSE
jgi:F0F1-type ATP synthase assembly protein I